MDEKNIEKAKNDLRVKFNYLVNDKINTEENEKNFVHNCNGLVF